jgi:hypothetical protein
MRARHYRRHNRVPHYFLRALITLTIIAPQAARTAAMSQTGISSGEDMGLFLSVKDADSRSGEVALALHERHFCEVFNSERH